MSALPPVVSVPARYVEPVVVAFPFVVRPSVPLPIVELANAVRPPLNCVKVEVALPASEKGYSAASEEEATLLLKRFQSLELKKPLCEPLAWLMPITPPEYVSGEPETEIADWARALVKYKFAEPSLRPSVVVAYQLESESFALSAVCRSV